LRNKPERGALCPDQPFLLVGTMTSEECHLRARTCAANAEASRDAVVASQFVKLAVRWRAMALGERSLGPIADGEADVVAPVPSGRDCRQAK